MAHTDIWGLIAKHLSGESTEEEESELTSWRSGSEDNERIYVEVRQLWAEKQPESAPERLERGKGMVFQRIKQDRDQSQAAALPVSNWWSRRSFVWKAAAVLLVSMLGWLGYSKLQLRRNAVALTTVENVGQPKEIRLPDGSTVWLNSESRLRYPEDFSEEIREVYLEGEGFFQVQRNEHKPFIVHAGSLSTQVLGTSFNINAYPEMSEIKVTVSSGKVSVSDSTGVLGVLVKDQQIAYEKATGEATREVVQAYASRMWKEGKLVFESETFGNVARILERRYGVSIQFSNQNIKNSPVSAQFDKSESLQQILYMVGLVTGTQPVFRDENHILISSNQKNDNPK